MPRGDTSSVDLDRYFVNSSTRQYYGGTWFKNELVHKPTGKFYIVNMQNSTDAGNGTHWVLAYAIDGRYIYMDPFGFTPPGDIADWFALIALNQRVQISKLDFQNPTSNACGEICAVMAKYYLAKNGLLTLNPMFKQMFSKIKGVVLAHDGFLQQTVKNDKIFKDIFDQKL